MNAKNRIQVIIPEHLKEAFLKEVARTKHTESSLAVFALMEYLKGVRK